MKTRAKVRKPSKRTAPGATRAGTSGRKNARTEAIPKQSRSDEAAPITVLLVDDHDMVRKGLQVLLRDARRIAIVGEAGTMADAIRDSARLKPSVVLMDLRLPDGSGVEACRDIRAKDSRIRVIFLSSVEDDEAVMSSIAAGADGYLLKDISGHALARAIETVAAGQSILDPSVTQRVLARMRAGVSSPGGGPSEELSPQERRVLALVTEGKTNKEIASALDLSPKTVRNYLSNVFQKLQVTRRSQAAVLYTRRYPK